MSKVRPTGHRLGSAVHDQTHGRIQVMMRVVAVILVLIAFGLAWVTAEHILYTEGPIYP